MDEGVTSQGVAKRLRVVSVTLAVVLLASAVILTGVYARSVPRGVDVDLIATSKQLTPAQAELETVLAASYHEYRNNASWWSFAYYGCLFGSAFLSAMAALILKWGGSPDRTEMKKDVAALCATTAALLITVSTVGNFQQKWQANRLAATAVQNLVYEVWKTDAADNKANVSSRMEQINLLRNQEIVGGAAGQGKPSLPGGQASPSGENPAKGAAADDPSNPALQKTTPR
jgi:hypothetical protein